MSCKLLKPNEFDTKEILQKLRKNLKNSNDVPNVESCVINMIYFMLPRKQESVYRELNANNLARNLASFVPTDSFEEIKRKHDLDDPVRYNLNIIYCGFPLRKIARKLKKILNGKTIAY
jgi:hypothetical protein